MTRTVAVVPVRDGTSGKSRLADVLAPADRGRLVVALARHVVSTVLASGDVSRVVVVTADEGWAWTALAGLGTGRAVLDVVTQASTGTRPGDGDAGGLDAAVDLGRAHALTTGRASRLLVVHADLPALAADDVAALLAGGAPVTLAPDRAGTGTNAVVLAPAGTGFTFRFGPGSGAAHRAEAARRGLDVAAVRRPGTATDLDTAADWDALPAPVRARLAAEVPATAGLGAGALGQRGVPTGPSPSVPTGP